MTLPRAILVDLDGTIAIHTDRSPYDWQRVDEDLPNHDVIEVVKLLASAGVKVIFMSGRDGCCRDLTLDWITQHVGWPRHELALFMREPFDMRKDAIVKAELFDAHIAGKYDVMGVFDDRNQVVAMWRQRGLTCYQVADGDF